MTEKENRRLSKLIKKGIREFPKVLARKKAAFKEKQKRVKAFESISKSLQKRMKQTEANLKPVHPWRLCPLGQFYRKKHTQRSYTRATGIPVKGSLHPSECVINKTGKDQLYAEEIYEIATRNFSNLKNLPTAGALEQFPNESKYDAFIAGWTQYWNEVLQPTTPLDTNFVKALIASESGFRPDATNGKRGLKRAHGLMQVTDESVKLLSNRAKELKDHFLNLKEDDMSDPNASICAGIRWLFRKKEIAESKSKDVTWTKTVMLYKNYTSADDKQMQKFIGFYDALRNADAKKQ